MYSLSNNEIYDKTIDFIFSFDKNSNILNLNMIKGLYKIYNLDPPKTMKYFEKYYGSLNLTKNVLKNKDQSEKFSETYIKNGFKIYDNNGKLNIDSLYKDVIKIDPNLKIEDFESYVNETIFKNSDNSIDLFYNYILNLLKE